MNEEIINQLKELEKKENIKILYAAESGSRAWGFATPDSDFDVRFIYIRPTEFYLKLEKTRDVIELPVNDLLDINGWDFQKTLRLLYSSNPTLFEWSNSPIVYMTTHFFQGFKEIINDYFKAKSGLYHYLNMAEGNYREYLKGDFVKAKKYFYVLRPILACKWILENRCPPPMLFTDLVDSVLEERIKPFISNLLHIKMNTPEIGEIPKVNEINEYIEENLRSLKVEIDCLPKEIPKGWDELNFLFLSAVNKELF
ncbi:MAG: nucleotidyltransferase domain-containing protein [Clostridia bacterium]